MLQVTAFSKDLFYEGASSTYDADSRAHRPHSLRTMERCQGKRQLSAILDHLGALNARSMVIEDEYVDRDYLEDYSAYYVRSFPTYQRYCRRLHFFAAPTTPDEVELFLNEDTKERFDKLQSAYLGFVILRPLPGSFVGRTCLKTPATGSTRYHGALLRDYVANLAGRPFTVSSLAFQEQDRIVAACATSAVWSALHRTGHEFGIKIPTPSEITELAMRDGPRRGLPSDGLSVVEICQAVRRTGLEVELRENVADLKALLHGYTQYGLPVILGIELLVESDKGPVSFGYHAVTVSGLALANNGPQGELFSERITGVYVHDDQCGPFQHAALTTIKEQLTDTITADRWRIESGFPDPEGKGRSVFGIVRTLIVPLDDMIRIQYEEAKKMQAELRDILSPIFAALGGPALEWDIRLTNINAIRRDLGRHARLPAAARRHMLTGNFPKYLWRVTGRQREQESVDLLLDCTDIRRAFFALDLLLYDANVIAAVREVVRNKQLVPIIEGVGEWGRDWVKLLTKATV